MLRSTPQGPAMAIPVSKGWVTLLGLALAAPAKGGECRLALVLALDVSESVDATEDRLQRHGLARALLAPEVARAFLLGEPVALFVFEWASPPYQADVTPTWQVIHSEDDLARVAAAILGARERPNDPLPRLALRHLAQHCCMPRRSWLAARTAEPRRWTSRAMEKTTSASLQRTSTRALPSKRLP